VLGRLLGLVCSPVVLLNEREAGAAALSEMEDACRVSCLDAFLITMEEDSYHTNDTSKMLAMVDGLWTSRTAGRQRHWGR